MRARNQLKCRVLPFAVCSTVVEARTTHTRPPVQIVRAIRINRMGHRQMASMNGTVPYRSVGFLKSLVPYRTISQVPVPHSRNC